MIVEIVAVGTELLLGQIVNENAATIGVRLAEAGFDVHHSVMVGDNVTREAAVIAEAASRSEAVIITGGIGPTQDDLTREALCVAFDRPMEFSEAYAAELKERWGSSGRAMPESNLRQAEHPAGAELLANPKGSAPGLAMRVGKCLLFAVPGVPEEMRYLLDADVLPRLLAHAGSEAIVMSRVLRTWGRSESSVGEALDELYQGSANPSIAFLASAGEIKVRITAKAVDASTAEAMIAPVEQEVRRILGNSVFAVDDETIESTIAKLLLRRNWSIGTAESATGGLVAARLTSVPGSSRFYRGSVIAYAADLKQSLLGVRSKTLVSEETAIEMAKGAKERLSVDVAVAIVGSAGPEPLEQPAGTMVIAVATPDDARASTRRYPGDRERVRTYSSTAALHHVRLAITGSWW
ncbi:MAG TPA: competence/damage-inducible protein A [Acidimicrobiia bacterium]|jgi:nicotinamide-nucleotide amidase